MLVIHARKTVTEVTLSHRNQQLNQKRDLWRGGTQARKQLMIFAFSTSLLSVRFHLGCRVQCWTLSSYFLFQILNNKKIDVAKIES